MRFRTIAIAALLLSPLTLVACGPAQLQTETYGYGARYYQLGHD